MIIAGHQLDVAQLKLQRDALREAIDAARNEKAKVRLGDNDAALFYLQQINHLGAVYDLLSSLIVHVAVHPAGPPVYTCTNTSNVMAPEKEGVRPTPSHMRV